MSAQDHAERVAGLAAYLRVHLNGRYDVSDVEVDPMITAPGSTTDYPRACGHVPGARPADRAELPADGRGRHARHDCTGHVDPFSRSLQHDGDTCPIHEGGAS